MEANKKYEWQQPTTSNHSRLWFKYAEHLLDQKKRLIQHYLANELSIY